LSKLSNEGCLAAAVCIKARDEKGPTIRGQLLVYPVVAGPSLIPSLESWTKYKANVLLTDDLMNRFYKEYITNDAQLTDPLVFPLHVADASNLPPAHFVTAGVDILLSEGRLYQQKLKEGGVVVTESYFPRQVWL
jgi:acetyl esterase